MALRVRGEGFGHDTGVRSDRLYRTSRLLSYLTGIEPQPNKAIVGKNAFAHESGIHQHGVLRDRLTYEIMDPETIGHHSAIILGKHSGRAAFADAPSSPESETGRPTTMASISSTSRISSRPASTRVASITAYGEAMSCDVSEMATPTRLVP